MKKKRVKRWHTCNVLRVTEADRALWQFNASERNFKLTSELTCGDGTALPPKLVAKTWRQLFQSRLNLAWIPPEHVFLRVVQLPACEDEELSQMLEFQLEKLSPMPVSQVVWTYQTIPGAEAGQLNVVLAIVEREAIDTFLGRLDDDGFHADYLDFPWIHELADSRSETNSLWLKMESVGDHVICLAGWWYDGQLRHLSLTRLPSGSDSCEPLIDDFNKTAWTGELEGWFGGPPQVTIVADEAVASSWETALQQWSGRSVQIQAPVAQKDLAALNARRVTRGESHSNLLPEDIRIRYRQLHFDGMWMRGLGTILMIYIFGVLLYFAALEWLRYQDTGLKNEVAGIRENYTNALQLQALIDVMQEQVDLKYSALDCLLAISELLPTELSLDSFSFKQGESLTLVGRVATAEAAKAIDYHESLINARVGDAPLFSSVGDPAIDTVRANARAGGMAQSRWSFNCKLNRSGF